MTIRVPYSGETPTGEAAKFVVFAQREKVFFGYRHGRPPTNPLFEIDDSENDLRNSLSNLLNSQFGSEGVLGDQMAVVKGELQCRWEEVGEVVNGVQRAEDFLVEVFIVSESGPLVIRFDDGSLIHLAL